MDDSELQQLIDDSFFGESDEDDWCTMVALANIERRVARDGEVVRERRLSANLFRAADRAAAQPASLLVHGIVRSDLPGRVGHLQRLYAVAQRNVDELVSTARNLLLSGAAGVGSGSHATFHRVLVAGRPLGLRVRCQPGQPDFTRFHRGQPLDGSLRAAALLHIARFLRSSEPVPRELVLSITPHDQFLYDAQPVPVPAGSAYLQVWELGGVQTGGETVYDLYDLCSRAWPEVEAEHIAWSALMTMVQALRAFHEITGMCHNDVALRNMILFPNGDGPRITFHDGSRFVVRLADLDLASDHDTPHFVRDYATLLINFVIEARGSMSSREPAVDSAVSFARVAAAAARLVRAVLEWDTEAGRALLASLDAIASGVPSVIHDRWHARVLAVREEIVWDAARSYIEIMMLI